MRICGWAPATRRASLKHISSFRDEGGSFARATLRCVGVGKCRRKYGRSRRTGTMCPSFMVTREERDATRGRAHASVGDVAMARSSSDGWRDENVKEALDLCLACKGCKGDCPVNVDMATYKAEFLSHYWEGTAASAIRLCLWLDRQVGAACSVAPGFVNLITQIPILRTHRETGCRHSARAQDIPRSRRRASSIGFAKRESFAKPGWPRGDSLA